MGVYQGERKTYPSRDDDGGWMMMMYDMKRKEKKRKMCVWLCICTYMY